MFGGHENDFLWGDFLPLFFWWEDFARLNFSYRNSNASSWSLVYPGRPIGTSSLHSLKTRIIISILCSLPLALTLTPLPLDEWMHFNVCVLIWYSDLVRGR